MLIDTGSRARDGDHSTERVFAPGILARLDARIRGHALDRALAAGVHPVDSPALAHRAAQLTAPRMRRRTADGIERLLDAAVQAPSPRRVSPSRAAVAAQADALRETAALLRTSSPVYARGVAILTILLSDGTGPAYAESRNGAFAHRLDQARAELSGRMVGE
jgi:nucleoside-diphosphate-sugar epimerase